MNNDYGVRSNLRYTLLEDFVIKIYNNLSLSNIGNLENIDIDYVSEKLNIKTYYYHNKCQAVFYKGKYKVFLNKYLTPQQQWQNFAHELGHIFQHVNDQVDDTYNFRLLEELEADNFAHHFCIPTFLLNQIRLPYTRCEAIAVIATTFNVEHEFASIRLTKWMNKLESHFLLNKAFYAKEQQRFIAEGKNKYFVKHY